MKTIELTNSLQQARGVIGRYPGPTERYVFSFDDIASRTVHMLGVHRPLCVTFYAGDELVREAELRPWIGLARERCDRIVEERPVGSK